MSKTRNLLFTGFLLLLLLFSCNKKSDEKTTVNFKKGEFTWHDNVTAADIPDFPIKGFLDGKEVQFSYINFERWRGSNDNAINFSLVNPSQKCGYIEEFSGFTLIKKNGQISQGEWVKSNFSGDGGSYQAYFKSGGQKSSAQWNCALIIESMDKTVKGKIALFFNDDKKSWLAGKFEAVICNN